jgi:hypothetical protein
MLMRGAILSSVSLLATVCVLSSAGASALAAGALPDNRAWEMVSPLEKNNSGMRGIDENSGGGVVQASADGSSITYVSPGSFLNPQGAPSGSQYLSTRGSEAWSTQNITTPMVSYTYARAGEGTPYEAFSSDLARRLLINGQETWPVENPPLPGTGAPPGYQNFYLYDKNRGGFQALLTSPPGESSQTFRIELTGATPDLKHVVIATNAALTTGMIDTGELNRNLYEWANGQFQPINLLPNGTPAPGAAVGSGSFESHTVSDDGSRVFWKTLPGEPQERFLYVRENGTETVQVDASHGPSKEAEAVFRTASYDGSKAFFTDRFPLTKDSTANELSEGEDLYEFDVNSRQLSDLTVDKNAGDPNGASVQGVAGASEDGSLLYFVAKGVLAGVNSEGRLPVSGGFNLYVHDGEGRTTFVATLSPDDEMERTPEEQKEGLAQARDWKSSVGARTTRVTSDGRHLVFMSDASLTKYKNIDASTGNPDQEVYSYAYDGTGAGRLSCVSCNPSGALPVGASRIPGGTDFSSGGVGGEALYQPRVLSEDGSRVFFDSSDALVPADTNGKQDVYEYENGQPYLISGGTSGESSEFVDASANGDDVFFLTSQALVPQDIDTLVDVYDARVGGGFSPPPTPAPPCGGEGCLPLPSAQPALGASASATFTGAGNLATPLGERAVKHKKHKHKHRKARHRKAKRATKGRKR